MCFLALAAGKADRLDKGVPLQAGCGLLEGGLLAGAWGSKNHACHRFDGPIQKCSRREV